MRFGRVARTRTVLATATAVLVSGGIAAAANVSDDAINACVKKNGEVRIAGKASDCSKNETALAWNNLGVLVAHAGDTEEAIEALRTALQLRTGFSAARLNLALLLYQLRRFQLSLEAYRQVLSAEPRSAAAWNGIGLVLVELKRFADARNAFVRAVETDPEHAGAHYNLSFTLSNLGDFDGALRATKRALELDPYYVTQKFHLTIDLQYEKATIGIAPEISADVTAEALGENFAFDERLLDNIFQELQPAPAAEPAPARADDPLALARDYVSKGLRPPCCWATSSRGAACTARRWSAIARRGGSPLTARMRGSAR